MFNEQNYWESFLRHTEGSRHCVQWLGYYYCWLVYYYSEFLIPQFSRCYVCFQKKYAIDIESLCWNTTLIIQGARSALPTSLTSSSWKRHSALEFSLHLSQCALLWNVVLLYSFSTLCCAWTGHTSHQSSIWLHTPQDWLNGFPLQSELINSRGDLVPITITGLLG